MARTAEQILTQIIQEQAGGLAVALAKTAADLEAAREQIATLQESIKKDLDAARAEIVELKALVPPSKLPKEFPKPAPVDAG